MKTKSLLFIFLMLFVNMLFSQEVKVNVDAKKEIGQLHDLFFGLNVARWDESLFPAPYSEMLVTCDRDAIKKVKDAKIKLLKYPGGNDADSYIWNDKNNNESEMDTDEFAAFCNELGAEGFITVNFNQPPELAAEWVRYCNIVNNYSIKYWEVGDEQWGSWTRGHTTPEGYAEKYIEFVKAMKAVDPTIKIAINVKMENDPDGWTVRSLKAAKDYVDIITITFFAVTNKQDHDEEFILSTPKTFIKPYLDVKDAVKSIFPKERWDDIWVIPVGYNTVNGRPGDVTVSIVNGLWVADIIGIMVNLGIEQTDYWALHNAYPPRGGDYGLLTSDSSNTPHYSYHALKMMADHLKKQMVEVTTNDTLLSVYASRDLNSDHLSLFLINKSKHDAKNVSLNIKNFEPKMDASVWLLNKENKNVKIDDLKFSDKTTVTVEPYSMKVIELEAKKYIPPPKNLALDAKATASSYSILGPNFGTECANDGIFHTRWRSESWVSPSPDGSDAQWFQLEFDKAVKFNNIQIYWDFGYAINYSILCSMDGKNWKTIKSISDGNGGLEEFAFSTEEAKFIKLDMKNGARAISTYNIKEIEVYNK